MREYLLDVNSEESPRSLNLIIDELNKLHNSFILKALFSLKDCIKFIKMVLDSPSLKIALGSSDKVFYSCC